MTFPKRLFPLAATAALPLLAACFERVDSTDVSTDGLYADTVLRFLPASLKLRCDENLRTYR